MKKVEVKLDAFTVKVIERFGQVVWGLRTGLKLLDPELAQELEQWDRHPRTMAVIFDQPDPEPDNNKDVHTEHCCFNCGCKYGHHPELRSDVPECTVTSGQKRQSFRCTRECDFHY